MSSIAVAASVAVDNLYTMDLLRALEPPATARARVRLSGYWEEGDGGEGEFYWDASATDDDDGGLVIKPDAIAAEDPGRWFRFYVHGEYNVKWWGAIGDGDSHTLADLQPTWTLEDWQAIFPLAVDIDEDEIDWLAAITASRRTQIYYPDPSGTGRNCYGGAVVFPEGLYLHNRSITPESGNIFFFMKWHGVGTQGAAGSAYIGGSAWIIYTGDDDRYFDLRSAAHVEFDGLTVWYNNAGFAGKTLFDCTWMPGVEADASHIRWSRCSIAGDPGVFGPGQGAKALISLHLAISCDVEYCLFGQAQAAIRFREFPIGAQSYSNKHNVRACSFLYEKWHLVNLGETITIDGNTVEGLGGYTEACVTDDLQRTEALPAVTFEIDQATQTITLVDASGRTWADYGFAVGMTPFLHDRLNRVNGPNNLTLSAITSLTDTVMTCPGSGLVDQTNTWGALQASQIAAGAPGAYCRATVGVELVFSASGATIVRDEGRWDDDGWTVGSSEIAIRGTADNDGVYGPITAISVDGKTMTIASASFTDETTSVGLLSVNQASGPFMFTGNWCGDQFLPGSVWLDFKNPIGSALIQGNALIGATRAINLFAGSNFDVSTNTISSVIEPIYVYEEGPGWSNAKIENNGAAMPLFAPNSQPCQQNLETSCNGQYAQDVIDLILDSVTFRSKLTVVAAAIGEMAGFDTAAIAFTQAAGGSMGLGSDAAHALIESFGGGGLFLNKLGGGYAHLGRVGSYNAVSKTATPHSALDCGGAPAFAYVTDTAHHTITDREAFCAADATLGARNWTLESAVGCAGRRHTIVKIDGTANAVSVLTTGGQTVLLQPGGSLTLANQGDGLTVVSNGADWVQEP